ncbi:Hypothetical predicted protein [Podarcis lilfordi]|uniref:Uncharacterized protein n=1 Tax=Podarcis lilfordi TaxID=74358 RepID=A0AA35PS86_9SAUR|nr:Hypothetical predicted protein [Podarcis lilfordi]
MGGYLGSRGEEAAGAARRRAGTTSAAPGPRVESLRGRNRFQESSAGTGKPPPGSLGAGSSAVPTFEKVGLAWEPRSFGGALLLLAAGLTHPKEERL